MEVYIFFLKKMYFRFWGTYADHEGLLHRYIYGSVVCCLPPHHLYLAFLPMLSLPKFPPPAIPPLGPAPPNRPQHVMFPSLCLCVLIVQYPLMSENIQCLIFHFCVSLLRMIVCSFIHVSAKDMNSSFFMAAQYSMVYICHIFV